MQAQGRGRATPTDQTFGTPSQSRGASAGASYRAGAGRSTPGTTYGGGRAAYRGGPVADDPYAGSDGSDHHDDGFNDGFYDGTDLDEPDGDRRTSPPRQTPAVQQRPAPRQKSAPDPGSDLDQGLTLAQLAGAGAKGSRVKGLKFLRRGAGKGPKGDSGAGKPPKGPKGSADSGGKPGRRKDPLWARLTVFLGALLMLASGGTIIGSKMLVARYAEGIDQQNLLGSAAKSKEDGRKALEGDINLLLLGIDERVARPGDVRSDTIIVLHIPETHDQAYLVSVPRDTFVDVPAFEPAKYPGGRTKITEAFHAGYQNGGGRPGGAQLVAQTINKMTGIQFDGAAIVDFWGLKRVVDALGGVEMCVDHEVTSQHMVLVDGEPTWLPDARKQGVTGKPVVHKKGCQRMEGWEALDYSRQRYGLPRGDYDRQRHQQQLLKAMAKEGMGKGVLTNPAKLDRVIKGAGSALTLDTGGVDLLDFVFTLKGVAANDLVLVRTNAGNFNSADINGTSAEELSPESLEMFKAVKRGELAEWLVSHPEFVSKEK